MERQQKLMSWTLWVVLAVVMVAVVATGLIDRLQGVRAQVPAGPAVLFDTPAFALTDQNGRPFGDADLRGEVYVADFIFTSCAGVCPMMSQNMANLQKELPKDVRLVSFTVDPATDTPPVLKKYAARYDADDARWHFLTGTKDAIFDVASGMKLTALPATADQPILHSEKFLLVDGEGHVRGAYNGRERDDLSRLIADAKQVSGAK